MSHITTPSNRLLAVFAYLLPVAGPLLVLLFARRKLLAAYHAFADDPGFARVATLDEIARQEYSLSIPLYVKRSQNGSNELQADAATLPELWAVWEESGRSFWLEMDELVVTLDSLVEPEVSDE